MIVFVFNRLRVDFLFYKYLMEHKDFTVFIDSVT